MARRIVVAALAVVLVGLAAGCGVNAPGGGRDEAGVRRAAEEFWVAFRSGDSDALYQTFTAACRRQQPKKELAAALALARAFLPDLDKMELKVTKVTVDGDEATVDAEVVDDKGKVQKDMNFQSQAWAYEDGAWRISDCEDSGGSEPGSGGGSGGTTSTTEAPRPGDKQHPLDMGQAGPVDDWKVTLRDFVPDATTAIQAESEFNDPPTKGQYAMVTVDATYQGTGEGDPSFDLDATLVGGDAVHYDDSDCSASTPNDLIDAPTLEKGGSASGTVCFDVPPAALNGATIYVETFGFDTQRTYWTP